MNVVFAGGGTGGHIYPAIAIADALRERHPEISITFVGTADRLEAQFVPQAGYSLEIIAARPFSVSPGFVIANIRGIVQSLRIVRKLRPEVVVATGGYVCFPLMIAARMVLGKHNLFLLEPNAHSGLTNRLLTPLVAEVWRDMPVRKSLTSVRAIPCAEARARLGLDPKKNVLLVMGGSQGARSLNASVVTAVTMHLIPDWWQIVLVTGKQQETPIPSTPQLRIVPYLDDLSDVYAAANLVLARAGASTLAELRFTGLPAILVPYPFAADDHQTANAQAFARDGRALVVEDAALNAETLAGLLKQKSAFTEGQSFAAGANPMEGILARIERALSRKHP